MKPCVRGPAPELLAGSGGELGRAYAERREREPAHQFRWPPKLYVAVRAALQAMTDEHCAYCDGSPIDEMGKESVDHFRPKGTPAFYALVCDWENLFFACTGCNSAKREQWDEALLRPDVPDFSFERYFEYRFDTGELHPNTAAPVEHQHRARRTIEILDLNRAGMCKVRRRTVRLIQVLPDDERTDLGYRYLIPLCG